MVFIYLLRHTTTHIYICYSLCRPLRSNETQSLQWKHLEWSHWFPPDIRPAGSTILIFTGSQTMVMDLIDVEQNYNIIKSSISRNVDKHQKDALHSYANRAFQVFHPHLQSRKTLLFIFLGIFKKCSHF